MRLLRICVCYRGFLKTTQRVVISRYIAHAAYAPSLRSDATAGIVRHMQKRAMIAVLMILILLGAGWFVVAKKGSDERIPNVPSHIATTTEVLTTDVTATTTSIVLDYSSLEKDTLYGEEEGQYENLPEIGKQLLRGALTLPECIDDPENASCIEYEWRITNSRIVSYKNGLFLLSVPSGKGPSSDKIYNLKSKKFVGDSIRHSGNIIRNDEVLIYVHGISDKTENLLYYRPGMSNFAEIKGSELSVDETYIEPDEYVYKIDISFLDKNTIKASIFDENQLVSEDHYGSRVKIREKTFVIE